MGRVSILIAISTAAMMFIKLYYGDTFICLVKLLMLAMKLFLLFEFMAMKLFLSCKVVDAGPLES